MSDEPQAGGAEWERNQAVKRTAAGLIAHDAAEIGEGVSDLGDAVVNATVSRLMPTFTRALDVVMTKKQDEQRETFRTLLETEFANHDRRDARRTAELQQDVIARMDAQWRDIDAHQAEARAAWEESARGLGKLSEDIETLRAGYLELQDGQAHLRKDHVDFRTSQDVFRAAQEILISRVKDLDENFDTLQRVFDTLRDEGARRWMHATSELADQRVIIERKEIQIKQLIDEVRSLREELEHVRAQTIADELSADDRRRLTQATRWLDQNRDRIVLDGDTDHGNA